MKRLRGLLLWVMWCSFTMSFGQIYKYVGLEDGLSSRNVYAVQQSNGGFMWLLTDNGIDRYDGSNISKYTIRIGGQKFTEYSTCRLIHDSINNNTLLVTRLGRVVQFDKRDNMFKMVYSPEINANKVDLSGCAASPIDDKGNIWILVGDEAFRYNVLTREGIALDFASQGLEPTFSAVVSKDSSTLYVGNKKGVYVGHIDGEKLTLDTTPVLGDHHFNVNTLFYNKKHEALLVGTEDAGIVAFKEQEKEVIHHSNVLPDVRVTKILPINDGDEVIFSTNAACVYQLALDNCVPKPYLQADFNTDYRMNTDNVVDMCIDRNGQLWLCTFPNGLTIRNEQYPGFNWLRRSNLNNNTLVHNGVNCILEDGKKDMWFATENGISFYRRSTKQWYTLLSLADESPNPNHYFLTLCEVKPGIVLVGGYASGIYVVEKSTCKAQFVKPSLMAPEKYIQTMFLDPSNGSVWMAGDNQLFNVCYKEGIQVNYAEVFGGINYITQKDSEHLWIGTKNGLYIFNKKDHEKRRVELPLERFKVNTLFQDSDGTLYIGTHHHGLLVYNEVQNYYTRYSKKNSALTDDCMKCIVNAGNGSLYISSDGGIVRFNKATKRITTWTNDQGLQGINFSIHSGIRTHRNTIMFGGDCGAIEISEEANLPHIYEANLILADLYIGNTRVNPNDEKSPLDEAMNDTKYLRLSNSQRDAAIKVKNINHIYPSDCLVAWTTDCDLDAAVWNELNEDNFITLNRLKPGKYVMTIRSTSKESGKILDEHTLELVINPPFYFSFLGIVIELAILMLAFILVIKITKASSAMHISDEKVKFFINTAHDLRTPITLIKAPLEELNESSTLTSNDKESIALALRNTNTLAEMTDNVMKYEMESIEKGLLRIECHEAIAYIGKQIERWRMLAQIKQQHIEYVHPEAPFYVWVDVRKLNSIIQNLLSNAIKYSGEEETITFTLYEADKVWGFHVVDNGIGIEESEQKKLFNQLFRGTNAINAKVLGSGIGLLSIGRYVKSMKGKIEVSSSLNKGADFHVRFPMGKEHYDPHTTLFIEKPQEDAQLSMNIRNEVGVTNDADSRTRLLIVEDNPELLGYLSKIFEKEYRIYTATNGKEALSKLHYIQPTIVLSDVMMPEMRGDDLCVSIKSNIDTSHIAVVLMSALSDQQSIINGLVVKADAYVTKPFDMKILQLTIRNLVESRQKLRERLAALEEINENVVDGTSELDLKLMKEMKDIIISNLDNQDFTIDTLAYELRVSRTTLYNKVKGLTGNTPSDIIREARVNKAKKLLREHRYSMTEISEMVGFADQKYFREVFKKSVGMTPSEFVKTKED